MQKGIFLQLLWEYIKSMKSIVLKNKIKIRFAIRSGLNYLLNDCKYNVLVLLKKLPAGL